jgi:hypothetical protein
MGAMEAPVKHSDVRTFFNCAELWRVRCKPRPQGRAECAYEVARGRWDHATFARDTAGSWNWVSGDRLCQWTGQKSL